MNKFEDIAAKLLEGQKVTIFSYGEFGLPQLSHTSLIEVKATQGEKYQGCFEDRLSLIHEPARDHRAFRKEFNEGQRFIIWPGHVEIPADLWEIKKEGNGYKISESRYPCFDIRFLTDTLKAVPMEPLAVYNRGEAVPTEEVEAAAQ